MASYNEMLVGTRGTDGRPLIEREGVKRFTFVCGPDRLLVEEVVDAIRQYVDPDDMDYVSMYAGEVQDKEIWAALNQYPLGVERWDTASQSKITPRKLVIVRDAEKIKKWGQFTDWMMTSEQGSASRALVIAVFVSNKHSWPKDWQPDVRDRVVKSGRLIECGPLNDREAVAYLLRDSKLDEDGAAYLLRRVGGDIEAASNCVRKMRYFKVALTHEIIDRFTTRAPAEDFIGNLLAMKKVPALEAIEQVPDEDIDRIIAFLDVKLMQLSKLNRVTKRYQQTRDIIQNSKLPAFVVTELLPHAKYYDREKVSSCVKALALVDDAQRRGARDAVLETLVARW